MLKIVRVTDDRRVYVGQDGQNHSSSNVYAEITINGNVRRFLVTTVFKADRNLLDLSVDDFIHLDVDGQPIDNKTTSKK